MRRVIADLLEAQECGEDCAATLDSLAVVERSSQVFHGALVERRLHPRQFRV